MLINCTSFFIHVFARLTGYKSGIKRWLCIPYTDYYLAVLCLMVMAAGVVLNTVTGAPEVQKSQF
jgi:hypothetical protein